MGKSIKKLIKYLNSYNTAMARVEDLRARRERISQVLGDSYHGIVIDGMPKGGTVTDGMDKVVGAIDKVEAITEELKRQEAEAKDYAADIIAVLSLLPEGSDERRALELRFIDRLSTEAITERLNVAVATYWRIYERALNDLVIMPYVRAIVDQMEA